LTQIRYFLEVLKKYRLVDKIIGRRNRQSLLSHLAEFHCAASEMQRRAARLPSRCKASHILVLSVILKGLSAEI
jgi:hypothetical protein